MANLKSVKDIFCKSGSYKDKDGNDKTKFIKLGVLFEYADGGLAGKFDSVPVNWDGSFLVSDRQEKKSENPF